MTWHEESEGVTSMDDNDGFITIAPSKVTRLLAIIAVLLVLSSVATQVFRFTTGYRSAYGLIELFYLDCENNIPTFFSASMLLFAAVLVGIIAALKRKGAGPYVLHWAVLACVFLVLATDEAASIHELLSRPTRELFGAPATGMFFCAWVVPGIALVVVLAFAYLRFWLHLPSRTRLLVLVAGSLYLAGAIGVELIGGRHADLRGTQNLTYSMIVTIEESLEMAGVILFVFAMLDYIRNSFGEVRLRFSR